MSSARVAATPVAVDGMRLCAATAASDNRNTTGWLAVAVSAAQAQLPAVATSERRNWHGDGCGRPLCAEASMPH